MMEGIFALAALLAIAGAYKLGLDRGCGYRHDYIRSMRERTDAAERLVRTAEDLAEQWRLAQSATQRQLDLLRSNLRRERE